MLVRSELPDPPPLASCASIHEPATARARSRCHQCCRCDIARSGYRRRCPAPTVPPVYRRRGESCPRSGAWMRRQTARARPDAETDWPRPRPSLSAEAVSGPASRPEWSRARSHWSRDACRREPERFRASPRYRSRTQCAPLLRPERAADNAAQTPDRARCPPCWTGAGRPSGQSASGYRARGR